MTVRKLSPNEFKSQLIFGFIATFLCGLGFSIIMPVVPFLVAPYTSNSNAQAFIVTLLISTYAICVFIFAPIMGSLSDRFGRRPILLINLLGSALGFFIFGLGGALWVLFLGRIIEGVTGGIVGTIFAYFSDFISRDSRTKYFGWISATAGLGAALGPVLGGGLSVFSPQTPLFVAASISLLNFFIGYFFIKETKPKNQLDSHFKLDTLNPFSQFKAVFKSRNISRILLLGFLLWLPNGALQGLLSQMSIDSFKLQAAKVGLLFSIIGVQDILSQAIIMPQLLKYLSSKQIMKLGVASQGVAYACLASAVFFNKLPVFIVGLFMFGFGESIFSPAFNGLLANSVSENEQGKIQGSSQSIQALARIIGPVLGGLFYTSIARFFPMLLGTLLCLSAFVYIKKLSE